MNTKVKGEAIKEGSIPLSALSDRIRKEFEGKFGYSNFLAEFTTDNQIETPYYGGYLYIITKDRVEYVMRPWEDSVTLTDGPNVTISRGEFIYDTNGIRQKMTLTASGNFEWYHLTIYCNKKELPTTIVDWNAQPGEAGYIENKPFQKIILNGIIESDNTIKYDYNISTSAIYISYEGKEILHFIDSGGDEEATLDWPNIKIYWNGMDQVVITNLSDDTIDYIKDCISVYVYEFNERLPSSSIEDTVIKTFRQRLSDDAKNQALANLGIDPVVWKYLCNPYILKNGETIPSELISERNSAHFKYRNKGMYLIHVNSGNINDKEWDFSGDINTYIPVFMIDSTGEVLYGTFTFTTTDGEMACASVMVYCSGGKVLINSYQN